MNNSGRDFIPFHAPDIGEAEINSVLETLRSGWLTTGPKVRKFEEDFSTYVGCRHAVAVNSCTAALHLALDAIGLKEGDEVIIPTVTFAATAEVVQYFKATPVLVDCERDTLNLDPFRLEAAITSKTKAIIPVHFGGQPCDMRRILEIAKLYRLNVIEDAAHALPATYRGKRVGNVGDITCFSFYATKTITTGEGGMATTENFKWAQRMRMMSLHGISHDAWKRYTKAGSWYYEIINPGFKYNLTDIAAAIGIEQLKKCDAYWESRKRISLIYDTCFADLPQIQTPVCRPDIEHAWHLYVIQLNPERLTLTRNEFVDRLREEGIGTSVHFIPLHLHPYYCEKFGYKASDFPNASAAFERILSLPIYPRMSETDVEHVVGAVTKISAEHRR